jgi:hypothetical protein
MKTYITTTTHESGSRVLTEIFRIDPNARIQYVQENTTVLRVRSKKMSAWTLEAIAGVAQVFAEAAQ